MTITGAFKLFFWLFAVPVPAGLLFAELLPQNRRTPAVVFVCGMLVQFAVFTLIAVPAMLLTVWNPFYYTYRIFLFVMAVLCAAGFVAAMRRLRMKEALFALPQLPRDTETRVFWALFAAVVLFQIGMALTHASFDGDDAYYVTQSLIAQQTERMYTLLPYTGLSTSLDVRHALAVLPVWEAFVAKFAGVHATIVAHTALPVFLIPFTYLAAGLGGSVLCGEKAEKLPVFLVLFAVFQMFGHVSIYTSETFFLTRTWQGKAVMAGTVIPLVFWIFAWLFEEGNTAGKETRTGFPDAGSAAGAGKTEKLRQMAPWLLLALTGVFSGVCTSIGVFLGAGLNALFALALAIYTRKPRSLLYAALATLPNVVYVVLFLTLRTNVPYR